MDPSVALLCWRATRTRRLPVYQLPAYHLPVIHLPVSHLPAFRLSSSAWIAALRELAGEEPTAVSLTPHGPPESRAVA